MIQSSTIKIYSDSAGVNLVDTLNIIGNTTEGTTTALQPGKEYYASVETVDDQMHSSGESALFKFYSLPQVQFTGYVNRSSDSFIRQMSNTTDVVGIDYNGICWDTSNTFTNPTYTEGNTVYGLEENTKYYYRPFVVDEFGRRWVNTSDTNDVTTLYAIPTISWISIYGATAGSFSATINITSGASLTSVIAEVTTSGVTTTRTLTAQTGEQNIVITGLMPNTNYDVRIKATNSTGDGYSVVQNFTTDMSSGLMSVSLVSGDWVSNEDNTISGQSVATFDPNTCTIVKHYVEVYDNDAHSGVAAYSYDGGTNTSIICTISGALPDQYYFVFGKVTYYVGADTGNVYTEWSTPMQIRTYSLLNFDSVNPSIDSVEINYSVAGDSMNTIIEYSNDETNWIQVPVSDPQTGSITVTGLISHITYYLRGRVDCAAGRSAYVTTQFDTN